MAIKHLWNNIALLANAVETAVAIAVKVRSCYALNAVNPLIRKVNVISAEAVRLVASATEHWRRAMTDRSEEEPVCSQCKDEIDITDYCFTCESCRLCCKCSPDESQMICPNCRTQVFAHTICDTCHGCSICICTHAAAEQAETNICPHCENAVDNDDICKQCGNCTACCICSW